MSTIQKIIDFIPQQATNAYHAASDLTTELKTDPNFQFRYLKTFLTFGIILILMILFLLQTTLKTTFSIPSYLYIGAIILSLSFLFITKDFLYSIFVSKSWVFGLLIFGYFCYRLYGYFPALSAGSQQFISIILYTLLTLIVIIALSIFFSIFMNYFKSMDGILGFLVYFIFYIPCLFIDLVAYLKNEYKMTSNIVFVLFVLEIIVVILYMYLPTLLDKIMKSKDAVLLLPGAVFLDSSKIIGNADILAFTSDVNSETTYKKEYSVSMWIYVNAQPLHQTTYSKEVNIFDMGNGKPKIAYVNNTSETNTDVTKDKYIVYFTDAKVDSGRFEVSMEKQKWNNVVINYYGNSADLFVNGSIIRSAVLNGDSFPTYKASDIITVGSQNGLHGAICNVYLSKKPISPTEIARTYNLLMFHNPPIVKR